MSTERLLSKTGLAIAAIYLVVGFVVLYVLAYAAWRAGAPPVAAIGGAGLVVLAGAATAVLRARGSIEAD